MEHRLELAAKALAIECAEAFAEMLHARIRTLWGFPDPPELSIEEKDAISHRGRAGRAAPGVRARRAVALVARRDFRRTKRGRRCE